MLSQRTKNGEKANQQGKPLFEIHGGRADIGEGK